MKASGTIEVCCHQVEWWYDIGRAKLTTELRQYLEEEAESRAKQCISDGCGRGELCCTYHTTKKEYEFHGWFNIEGWN